jgi:hypothetical protein
MRRSEIRVLTLFKVIFYDLLIVLGYIFTPYFVGKGIVKISNSATLMLYSPIGILYWTIGAGTLVIVGLIVVYIYYKWCQISE